MAPRVFRTVAIKEIDGKPYFVNTGGLPFGEIYIYENSVAQEITSGVLSQLVGMTAGESNNTTLTSSAITVLIGGVYSINMSVSYSGSGSTEWTGGFYTNDNTKPIKNMQSARKLGAGGDVGSVSISGKARLSAGDLLQVWFMHEEGVAKNITVRDFNMSIVQVGG